ncbi:MAG: hypothetical protein O7D30_11445, partial [Rickettsia endosymbiont of Ixodes persulcatus]|nr:hypothetical protein [Rickettsia endosymbiont of Ixodes persulcatus]
YLVFAIVFLLSGIGKVQPLILKLFVAVVICFRVEYAPFLRLRRFSRRTNHEAEKRRRYVPRSVVS